MGQIQANRHFLNQHPRWDRRPLLIQGHLLRQINVAYPDRNRIITQTDRFALSYLRKQVSSSLPAEWIPATSAANQLIIVLITSIRFSTNIGITLNATRMIQLWLFCNTPRMSQRSEEPDSSGPAP
jgi:hypothetical protein